MAQCIKCNADIPDGTELCENCSSLELNKADESYLDSLLNSLTPSDDTKDIYLKKKQNNEKHETDLHDELSWNNKTEDSLVKPIPKDYNIFSTSDNDSELEFLNSLFGNEEENESEEQMGYDTQEEIDVLKEEPEILPEINQIEADIESIPKHDIEQVSLNSKEKEPVDVKDTYDYSDSDQDILDLINEINNTEEYHPEESEIQPMALEEEEPEDSQSLDMSDIYTDALSAVTSLDDMQLDQDLMNMIPEKEEPVDLVKEAPVKNSQKGSNQKKTPKKQSKKKGSLWKRIFGNIREEISEEELEARKQKVIEQGEKKEQDKLKKAEALKAQKEKSKAEKAEKAQKAKEEAAKKKADNIAKAKAKKEEKEKRSREIQELIDEIDENEGKINKVGASIVFVFFAATAIVIVIGTNLYSYAINIKNAKESFSRQLYNDAYEDVYGIEVKDEDLEIYDKIMTVMYVNKQLNSYTNFLNMKKYPEALDSLLKGLERYEKYYMLASLNGTEDDLNYVKKNIIKELKETFLMSEDDAKTLLAYKDQTKYSMAVYELANEHVKDAPKEETKKGAKTEKDSSSNQDTSTKTESKTGN